MTPSVDFKQAAIEQWTADPCGPQVGLDPGTRTYFERLLHERHAYAPWMLDELDYASTAGMRVLDVGCGQGIDLARYAAAGATVTGIDLTPRHVELARLHLAAIGHDAKIVSGDAEEMPFPSGTFDRVSSNGVLHHTPDMPVALQEILRVLAPGGEARIVVYNHASFHYWINQFLYRGILRRELLHEHSMAGVLSSGVERSSIGARPLVHVYSPWKLRRMMRDVGFRDVSTTVRHMNISDAFILPVLARAVDRVGDAAFLDRIGRIGGWYVIGSGVR